MKSPGDGPEPGGLQPWSCLHFPAWPQLYPCLPAVPSICRVLSLLPARKDQPQVIFVTVSSNANLEDFCFSVYFIQNECRMWNFPVSLQVYVTNSSLIAHTKLTSLSFSFRIVLDNMISSEFPPISFLHLVFFLENT